MDIEDNGGIKVGVAVVGYLGLPHDLQVLMQDDRYHPLCQRGTLGCDSMATIPYQWLATSGDGRTKSGRTTGRMMMMKM
uniref:Uncharacterized protein n=1 Tax=Arundo donax TaxID=35708 RepID=A0A0A9DBN8_ARUDO